MQVPMFRLLLLMAMVKGFVVKGEMVPAMFIFGDSLIDNGNNNNLASFAKANYYPYGIDFADGPTGRFSNGYTVVDEIGKVSIFSSCSSFCSPWLLVIAAQLLGLPLIPAHSQATSTNDALHGLNYASAAAGILDITGQNFVRGALPIFLVLLRLLLRPFSLILGFFFLVEQLL